MALTFPPTLSLNYSPNFHHLQNSSEGKQSGPEPPPLYNTQSFILHLIKKPIQPIQGGPQVPACPHESGVDGIPRSRSLPSSRRRGSESDCKPKIQPPALPEGKQKIWVSRSSEDHSGPHTGVWSGGYCRVGKSSVDSLVFDLGWMRQ